MRKVASQSAVSPGQCTCSHVISSTGCRPKCWIRTTSTIIIFARFDSKWLLFVSETEGIHERRQICWQLRHFQHGKWPARRAWSAILLQQAETLLRSVSAWMPRAYRAARSIPWIYIALRAPSGLCICVVEWNMWKSVAPQLQTCGIDRHWWRNHNNDVALTTSPMELLWRRRCATAANVWA